MNSSRAILLALSLALASTSKAQNDDFGAWLDVGLTKVLPRGFTVGGEAEMRTRSNSTKTDRLGIGVNATYKPSKYVKLGASYEFMDSYKDGKGKIKYKSDGTTIKNYKYTHSYWRPRHRLCFEVTPTIRVAKLVRFSLRERYQYTRKAGLTLDRDKYKYDLGYEQWNATPDPKDKPAKDEHALRSRLKVEIDKKKLAWSPFVSAETKNTFRHMRLTAVRAMAGTEYKVNKRNSLSLAYVLTYDKQDELRSHALSLSYDIKF